MTTNSSNSSRARKLIVALALLMLAVPFAIARPQQGSEQEARKKAEMERAQVEQNRQIEEQNLTPEQLQERRAKMELEIKARTKHQLELAKIAKISMEQAIQIASAQQQGTAIQCSLIHERDTAFYRVTIVSGDEKNPVSANVFVNAVDGTIVSFPNAGTALSITDEKGITRTIMLTQKP